MTVGDPVLADPGVFFLSSNKSNLLDKAVPVRISFLSSHPKLVTISIIESCRENLQNTGTYIII